MACRGPGPSMVGPQRPPGPSMVGPQKPPGPSSVGPQRPPVTSNIGPQMPPGFVVKYVLVITYLNDWIGNNFDTCDLMM